MDSPEPRISGRADAASSGAGTVSQVPPRSSAHEVRHLSLTPWQLLLPLFAFEGFLLAMHAFVHTAPAPWDNLQIWFDLGAEGTVPAWFSSGQFLLVGLALLAAAALRRGVSPSEMRLLLVAGLGFIFLSADEAAMIHERITRYFRTYEALPRFAGNRGVWVFVYGAIGLVLFAVFIRSIAGFVRRLPRQSLLMASGFTIIVLGAVGLEVLYFYDLWTGPAQTAAEESLEMVGASLILTGAVATVFDKATLVHWRQS